MLSCSLPQDLWASQTDFVCNGVERLREVDCCCPHFDSPLVAFLLNHSARRKVVCCLVWASESFLIFRLFLIDLWVSFSV